MLSLLVVLLASQASASCCSVVVANRAGKSVSVIDTVSDTVVKTISLAATSGEPMYVNYSPYRGGQVFVGDRKNKQVLVFNAKTYALTKKVPAGDGVFHQWADSTKGQLWVVNDVDKTLTVIDTTTLKVLGTATIPASLAALGKPHDVVVDPLFPRAYVSLVTGPATTEDFIIAFSTNTLKAVAKVKVGKDPHVSLSDRHKRLFVPCQNSDAVFVLARPSLKKIARIKVPGAHGAGMVDQGHVFYTTNLPGGGVNGLVAIHTHTNRILTRVNTTDTTGALLAVPHNIALTPAGAKLYVTHSGATSTKVGVYDRRYRWINGRRLLVRSFKTIVNTGLNPFGLGTVPRRFGH